MTGQQGEAAIDAWSLVHFASGLVLGLLPIGWTWGLGVVAGYEFLEGGLRRIKRQDGGLFEYESWPNIAADLVLGMLGFALMHVVVEPHLPWPWHLPDPFG